MRPDSWRLTHDAAALSRLARALGSPVAAASLRELARARKRGAGWLYLSELSKRVGEAPGSVSQALAKLTPFVEEKREKGLRYFRATVTDVTIELDRARR